MGETEEGKHTHPLPPGDIAWMAIVAVLLTCFGGLMSGLNLGMFSLDKRELEVRQHALSAPNCKECHSEKKTFAAREKTLAHKIWIE